jgi:hypothetical protein
MKYFELINKRVNHVVHEWFISTILGMFAGLTKMPVSFVMTLSVGSTYRNDYYLMDLCEI